MALLPQAQAPTSRLLQAPPPPRQSGAICNSVETGNKQEKERTRWRCAARANGTHVEVLFWMAMAFAYGGPVAGWGNDETATAREVTCTVHSHRTQPRVLSINL